MDRKSEHVYPIHLYQFILRYDQNQPPNRLLVRDLIESLYLLRV
jgi:hypothetical protein